ncbi:MAG TPA: DUF255 domain-containing protein [Polyangiales bacterium]|nr:DUF255 domain-containing protein [Polyangiales bacterium]
MPDFRGWSRTAFDEASGSGKYLVLSVQTQWCHWCHVMNDVTFRDPEVLAILRQHFVVVRVDADQRPDLAERYQRWGWPATGLLTPSGETIINLKGYREPREFARVLQRVAQLGAKAADAPDAKPPLDSNAASLRDRLDASWDATQGGWGSPQKYPRAAPIEYSFSTGDAERRNQALHALDAYAKLIDPVWGGMFQYSVHGDWEHPHYEKIHAVQAGALESFVQAYRLLREPRFLAHARSIQRYLLERLSAPQGGFYANQDADVGRPGDRGHQTGAEFYASSAAQRAAARPPEIDRHVYANQNGMTIAALVHLHQATLDPLPLTAAERAYAAIERDHRRGAGYTHAARDADPRLYLSDQVEMACALFALYETSGDAAYARRLRDLLEFVSESFEDARAGGFHAHTRDPDAPAGLAEALKPAALNARLARVLLWMARFDDDASLRTRAERAVRSADRPLSRELGEVLLALQELSASYMVVTIVAEPGDPRAAELRRAAFAAYGPQRHVHSVAPAATHYPYPGDAVAYLCTDDSCSLPLNDPAQLAAALGQRIAADGRGIPIAP